MPPPLPPSSPRFGRDSHACFSSTNHDHRRRTPTTYTFRNAVDLSNPPARRFELRPILQSVIRKQQPKPTQRFYSFTSSVKISRTCFKALLINFELYVVLFRISRPIVSDVSKIIHFGTRLKVLPFSSPQFKYQRPGSNPDATFSRINYRNAETMTVIMIQDGMFNFDKLFNMLPISGSSDVLVGFRAFSAHRTPTSQDTHFILQGTATFISRPSSTLCSSSPLNLCGGISRGSGISAHCKNVEYTPYRRPASGTKISKNPPEANTLHHLQFDVFSHLLLESCPVLRGAAACYFDVAPTGSNLGYKKAAGGQRQRLTFKLPCPAACYYLHSYFASRGAGSITRHIGAP
ncbi:hypothetical protein C8R43DRAFT_1234281 [Mycena crocata]|nr:hypothetical protein C8R43DRAFT_1234281 [Mycena crocata]